MATRRTNPGTWRKEKQNPNATKRRRWDLGAWINTENNLEIYRGPEEGYLKAGENKCLVLRQGDTGTNPEVLELVNEGTGDTIIQRHALGDSTHKGKLTRAGTWTNASSAELKENFKKMGDGVAERILDELLVRTYNYKDAAGVKEFGPTAEDFHSTTGFGDDTGLNGVTVASLAIRLAQLVWKRHKALEAQVASQQPQQQDESGE